MATSLFKKLFTNKKPIIGMLHIFGDTMHKQIQHVLHDLELLQLHVDGVLIENYGWGYQNQNRAEEYAKNQITEITYRVMEKSLIPVGINLLPNDYEKAFDICSKTGARFIQLDHITGRFKHCASVSPSHFISVRKKYPRVVVLGGIHPKYYRLTNPETPIEQSALRAKRLAHAIVVTGEKTGGAATIEDLARVKCTIGNKPLIIGSGLTPQNAIAQLSIADGAIVGSAFKTHGVSYGSPINPTLVKNLMAQVARLRHNPA